MTHRAPFLALLGALALGVPAASAQTPPPSDPTPPAPAPPAPAPKAGSASFKVVTGLATHKMRYVASGQKVFLQGRVRPYVAGQKVTIEVISKGKVSKRMRARVRRRGLILKRFIVGNTGLRRIVVRHSATAQQVKFRARDQRVTVVDWSAGAGTRGVKVLLLQRGLLSLGFATPVTGYYDDATARAVTAFRKTNGLGRDGYAIPQVYGLVMRHKGAFQLRYPTAGRHVEFDWSRQVLVLANGARPYRTYHASSGKPSTPTVFGTFSFYRKQPGTNSHGMVDSNYFIGGYAIHGYADVPNYPASHGCIRVPIPNADEIYRWIPLGMRIFVYE
ncbi:MAG TPA: L,D-transpeptidase family protein [Thermoleophilaceae bacterium]|jgi:lipoprotein-anchoring transpeptidase ErfK/SrfK